MTSERSLTFDVFATRIFQIVAAALAAASFVQSDFWWLLRAGQDVWHTGKVPLTEHYSYTAAGRDWSNHEWLWEAIAYAAHSVGGMPLVALMIAATVAATLMVLPRLTRASGYVVPAALLAILPPLSTAWTMRPAVTSLLLFAVTMLLLARERYRLVPVLFLVWANLHAQVAMGGLLLVAATSLAVVRWLTTRAPADRTRTLRLALTTALSALATLLTPLGPGLWRYVLGANGRPGQHEINEWHNAFEVGPLTIWFWILAATALAAVAWRRARLRDWSDQVCLAAAVATLPLAVLAIRNIAFFVLAVTPLLMTLLEFHHPAHPPGTVARPRRTLVAIAAVATAGVLAVWTLLPAAIGWRPVTPALATALRACPGHVFTSYNTGAPLIWWVPEVKVFVDNRQDPYPARILDVGLNISGWNYWTPFHEYDVRCALIEPDSALASGLHRGGWSQTYRYRDVSLWVAPAPPRATTATE